MADFLREVYQVFVPSKERAKLRSGTCRLLLQECVPFVVVTEPHEKDEYQAKLEELGLSLGLPLEFHRSICRVVPLPESGRGISFARNFILSIAPRNNWFWMLDDDISRFWMQLPNGRRHGTSARRVLCAAAARIPQFQGVGLFSLQCEDTLEAEHAKVPFIENSYNDTALLMNRCIVPGGVRYRFRYQETADFTLQVIRAGGRTVRFTDLSFRQVNCKFGGMVGYYENCRGEMREEMKQFLQEWPHVAEEVVVDLPGAAFLDLAVRWKQLDPNNEPFPEKWLLKGLKPQHQATAQPSTPSKSAHAKTATPSPRKRGRPPNTRNEEQSKSQQRTFSLEDAEGCGLKLISSPFVGQQVVVLDHANSEGAEPMVAVGTVVEKSFDAENVAQYSIMPVKKGALLHGVTRCFSFAKDADEVQAAINDHFVGPTSAL